MAETEGFFLRRYLGSLKREELSINSLNNFSEKHCVWGSGHGGRWCLAEQRALTACVPVCVNSSLSWEYLKNLLWVSFPRLDHLLYTQSHKEECFMQVRCLQKTSSEGFILPGCLWPAGQWLFQQVCSTHQRFRMWVTA